MGSDTAQAAHVRPFADILSEVQRGAVADDAATELAKLVAAVKETRKKGSITVTLVVAPMSGNDEVVNVSGTVTTKPPRAAAPASIFYTGAGGNLSRNDPNALELFPEREAQGAAR